MNFFGVEKRPPQFKNYPNMISYYVSVLYLIHRATGILEKCENSLYLLTWITAVVGILILFYRRLVGRPMYSYFLWASTRINSDLPQIIAKFMLIGDLLRNKRPVTIDSIRTSILIFLIYVQLVDISVYF